MSDNQKPEWLVWSVEHQSWWRPGERGYTPNLHDAGRYTFDHARQICREANDFLSGPNPNETMVHVDDMGVNR